MEQDAGSLCGLLIQHGGLHSSCYDSSDSPFLMGSWTHIKGLMDVLSGSISVVAKLRLGRGESAQTEALKIFISLSHRLDLGFFTPRHLHLHMVHGLIYPPNGVFIYLFHLRKQQGFFLVPLQ